MLSQLRNKLQNERLSLTQLKFYKGVFMIHQHLLNIGIKDGLANDDPHVLFPLDWDPALADLVDKMDSLGVHLDD